MKASLRFMAFLAASHLVARAVEQPGLLQSNFIFASAPFPSCQASTIAETPSGLVAAWFGGTRERHPDLGICLSRSENNRRTAPLEVASGVVSPTNRFPTWNPVLFQPRDGPLRVMEKPHHLMHLLPQRAFRVGDQERSPILSPLRGQGAGRRVNVHA